MEIALRSHLAGRTALANLVGERIQWAVRDAVSPCVAMHLIDAPPDWHLKGPSGVTIARVQIDCWDATYLGAKAVGDALLEALPAVGAVVGNVKFLGAQPIDLERDRFGEAPNLLFRTRIDVRVSFRQA